MRHLRQEALTGLEHRRLLLGRCAGGLGLDAIGDIPLVEQDAERARHGVVQGAAIQMVPPLAVPGRHAKDRAGRPFGDGLGQHGRAFALAREPVDKPHILPIDGERGRIAEQTTAIRIEQSDGPGAVSQGLQGAPLLRLHVHRGRFEQESAPSVGQGHRRDRGGDGDRLPLRIEGPALLHLGPVGRQGHQTFGARADRRREFGEVARQQFSQVRRTPQFQRSGVGVDAPARGRIEDPDRASQPVPGGQRREIDRVVARPHAGRMHAAAETRLKGRA